MCDSILLMSWTGFYWGGFGYVTQDISWDQINAESDKSQHLFNWKWLLLSRLFCTANSKGQESCVRVKFGVFLDFNIFSASLLGIVLFICYVLRDLIYSNGIGGFGFQHCEQITWNRCRLASLECVGLHFYVVVHQQMSRTNWLMRFIIQVLKQPLVLRWPVKYRNESEHLKILNDQWMILKTVKSITTKLQT